MAEPISQLPGGGKGSGNVPRPGSSTLGNKGITSQSLFAWGFLFAGLVILSDFPGAGELSAAFAMLILISVLLAFGPAAFDNISTLFS